MASCAANYQEFLQLVDDGKIIPCHGYKNDNLRTTLKGDVKLTGKPTRYGTMYSIKKMGVYIWRGYMK